MQVSCGAGIQHAGLLLLCILAAAQCAHCQTRQSGRGASVALTAKWGSTATVLEAAEFLVRQCHRRAKDMTASSCSRQMQSLQQNKETPQ